MRRELSPAAFSVLELPAARSLFDKPRYGVRVDLEGRP